MHIRIVTPITSRGFVRAEDFHPYIRPDTELSHVEIEHGPASIESHYDEMLATPHTVGRIVEAEEDGADAVVINCMGDPGMQAGREKVSIPVLGPCEATMHIASMLGHTFSVVTVLESLRPQFEHQAAIYGVREKLASVKSVNIPVLELEDDHERLVNAFATAAISALEDDGAHVMLFGCTGMLGTAKGVEKQLERLGYPDVPVIDSMVWAIKLAEAMVDMGLRHCKRTWPYPPEKAIAGYEYVKDTVAVAGD